MLDDLKLMLRISIDTYDDEISGLVEAAEADLALAGIAGEKIEGKDALIKRAIGIYVKANFGWNNPDSAKLQESYEMLRSHLALSAEYRGDADVV